MNRLEALESIRDAWSDASLPLGKKIALVSTLYYSAGLDLGTTAAYIRATPSELDALLTLGNLDDELLDAISKANPSMTTWTFLGNATDEEVMRALGALRERDSRNASGAMAEGAGECVYQSMVEIAAPTIEMKVANLSSEVITRAEKKSEEYGVLDDWKRKFLKSVAAQKKRGKTLSYKQADKLTEILRELVESDVVKRDSLDGDQSVCDAILDALER